jgi:hypothetical protein
MAQAAADHLYFDDHKAQERAIPLLTKLMKTPGGVRLLTRRLGYPRDTDRFQKEALAVLKARPDLIEKLEHAGGVPVLAQAIAVEHARNLVTLGGGQAVKYEYDNTNNDNPLSDAISEALIYPGRMPNSYTSLRVATGQRLPLDSNISRQQEAIYTAIAQVNFLMKPDKVESGEYKVNVAILPILVFTPKGPIREPLFRVDGPEGKTVFIDARGKVYGKPEESTLAEAFADWHKRNGLAGIVSYPEGGSLPANPAQVRIKTEPMHMPAAPNIARRAAPWQRHRTA